MQGYCLGARCASGGEMREQVRDAVHLWHPCESCFRPIRFNPIRLCLLFRDKCMALAP